MKKPCIKLDRVKVTIANNAAIRRIEKAKLMVNDPNKKERQERQLCVSCNYSERIGGQSITYSRCGICSREMSFPSTATDLLCKDCAVNNGLCKCCGADIDLKERRRPRSYEKSTVGDWMKISNQDAAQEFNLTTYEGEVILIREDSTKCHEFYFNAQEHFSKVELNKMQWWIK